jgi:membrane-bound lytic murein transglycosylase D
LRIGQTLYIHYQNNSTNTVVASKDNTVTTSVKEERTSPSENIRQETPGIYIVKNGDTLGHIALKLDVSLANLSEVNGLKSNKLKIGQVLTIPIRDKNIVIPTHEKPTQTLSSNNKYVVKSGDTMSQIAENFGSENLLLLSNWRYHYE